MRSRRNGKWVWRHEVVDKSNVECFFIAEGKVWDETWE